jgi:hypothetical protein
MPKLGVCVGSSIQNKMQADFRGYTRAFCRCIALGRSGPQGLPVVGSAFDAVPNQI